LRRPVEPARVKRKSDFETVRTAFDPQETSASIWREWFSPYRMIV